MNVQLKRNWAEWLVKDIERLDEINRRVYQNDEIEVILIRAGAIMHAALNVESEPES